MKLASKRRLYEYSVDLSDDAGSGHFFRQRFPFGWRILQSCTVTVRQRQRIIINTVPSTLSGVPTICSSRKPISNTNGIQYYAPHGVGYADKNDLLKVTRIRNNRKNIRIFFFKLRGYSKKIKNQLHLLFRPNCIQLSQHMTSPSRETVSL
jgi:hypothetical protein